MSVWVDFTGPQPYPDGMDQVSNVPPDWLVDLREAEAEADAGVLLDGTATRNRLRRSIADMAAAQGEAGVDAAQGD